MVARPKDTASTSRLSIFYLVQRAAIGTSQCLGQAPLGLLGSAEAGVAAQMSLRWKRVPTILLLRFVHCRRKPHIFPHHIHHLAII